MRIPTGDFGYRVAQPQRMPNANPDAFGEGVGQAMQQLGNTGQRVANSIEAEQERAAEKQRQETLSLARAKAGNALLDREIQVKTMRQQIEQGLADGSIPYEQAGQAFDEAIGKIEMPAIDGGDDIIAENLDKGAKRIDFSERSQIGMAVDRARKADHKTQTDAMLDKLGKLAGMPGADIEKVNAQAAALDALGQSAYGAAWGKKKQDFIDANWTQHAIQRSLAAADDIGALKQLQRDLSAEDGYYANKLDADKRNGIMRSVSAEIGRIENKIQHNADKMEARAERTLNEVERQISTGIPATPMQWAEWSEKVKGTTYEPIFKERIQAEVEVQTVLQKPVNEQLAYVQKQEQKLATAGGSVTEQANVARLRKAVDANIKQLSENPLQFNQTKTGQPVPPLDITALADPNRAGEVRAQMTDRLSALDAMRRQYGDVVKIRPFMPDEAQAVAKTLGQLAPDQQIEVFKSIRLAIPEEQHYISALSQVAEYSPVKSLAGTLAARGLDYVEEHTFSKDETISARKTAEYALVGESLLNPSKDQKAADGNTKTFMMPKKADMLRRFNEFVGDSFAGMPGPMDAQYEFVQAVYAGMLSASGKIKNPEIVDPDVMNDALERTTPVMKQGGVSFLKPVIGMSDEKFQEKLRAALPPDLKPQYDSLPLRNLKSNQYVIVNGATVLKDKSGNPLIITVQP